MAQQKAIDKLGLSQVKLRGWRTVENKQDFWEKKILPKVKAIPPQSIKEGQSFAKIQLDNYVSDKDHKKEDISWNFKIQNVTPKKSNPNAGKGKNLIQSKIQSFFNVFLKSRHCKKTVAFHII